MRPRILTPNVVTWATRIAHCVQPFPVRNVSFMANLRVYTPDDTALYLEITHHWVDRTTWGCGCGYRYFDYPSGSEHAEHVARAVLDKFTFAPRHKSPAPPNGG